MAIDATRRVLLKRAAALATATVLPIPGAVLSEGGHTIERRNLDAWPEVLGCWEEDGLYYAGGWSARHGVHGIMLPSRGHGIVADANHSTSTITVARRPGDYLIRFDPANGGDAFILKADRGRVFNGHAAFSADGATLYTTENATHDGSGFVGVRDAVNFVKRCELPTHGLDPHALLVERDGTLLVANGGILTRLETGRVKVDAERMDPSLVRIDATHGWLLGQWRLPDARLSIRHLARGPGGNVGIALQAEHASPQERERASPFALFDGASLHLANTPRDLKLGGYGGDIACVTDADGVHFVVSCLHANMLAWWNVEGQWQSAAPLTAPGALAAQNDALIVGSEGGTLTRIRRIASKTLADNVASVKWDNHIATCQPSLASNGMSMSS